MIHGGLVALAFSAAFCGSASTPAGAGEQPAQWRTIADNTVQIPGTDRFFGSFNQPSVNRDGVVVFRARSVGSSEPVSGIFRRRISATGQPVEVLFARGGAVPEPNNSDEVDTGGAPSGFREFPSIPRIDMSSDLVATRGNSTPVWIYQLPDGSETRVGTNGVFVRTNGASMTAFSLLGAVRDAKSGGLVFPEYSVPGAPEGTRFDVFPGSPSVSDGRFVVTKANWTDPDSGLGKTGVFVRDLQRLSEPSFLIASSDTVIPGQDPELKEPVRFGSTAPPSAAEGKVIFLGVDSEEAPTMGGLYAASIAEAAQGAPVLELLVAIGSEVPGAEKGSVFTRLGEGGAFNGRYVAFWGAWGSETRTVVLQCPVDGNPAIIAFCNEQHPEGFSVEIPVHQGMFVHDLVTGTTHMLAQTGSAKGDLTDFVYWGFSGRAPGAGGHGGDGGEGEEGGLAGEEDGELARWRSATFVSVESDEGFGGNGSGFRVAFKASVGETAGIYTVDGPDGAGPVKVIAVGDSPNSIDPTVSEGSVVTTLAIERESLRDGWFVISMGATNEKSGESRAGIYALGVPRVAFDFNRDGRSEIPWFNGSERLCALWAVDEDQISGGYLETRPASESSRLVGAADADGDGRSDMLWYDAATARYSIWLLDDGIASVTEVERHVGGEYVPVHFGDIDGDRRADVVFRRTVDGQTEVAVWLLDGATIRDEALTVLEGGFDELFVGNFDADAGSEAILRSLHGSTAGAISTASFSGATISAPEPIRMAGGEVAPVVSTDWMIDGTADTDGDGTDDVIWRGPNGSVEHWRVRERAVERHTVIWGETSSYWSIAAYPDFSGSGKRGVLFRGEEGETWKWQLDGTEITESRALRTVDPAWRIVERGK